MTYQAPTVPKAFIWKRLHSLTGVFLVLYLIEHLLVNSQAALYIGGDGSGFIESVNSIHTLPYLTLIEIFLLGVPIVIHAVWGIYSLQTSKINSFAGDGTVTYLPYERNKAYTWQRITSWFLLFAILAHVIHMRFIEYPVSTQLGQEHYYMVRLDYDEGLPTLGERLGVVYYDQSQIMQQKQTLAETDSIEGEQSSIQAQKEKQQKSWVEALENKPLKPGQVVAVSKNFGTAELLMVRETFKMPIMLALYTIFVLAACFHAFNGLWTAMISWGVTLTARSQKIMLRIATFLMFLVAFLGLSAIWITYWINLKQ